MRDEGAAPGTNSPPNRPSMWQLRFGKQSGSRMNSQQGESKPEGAIDPNQSDQAHSPSVSERLLRALDTHPKEQEKLGRECVDDLIGRRNAFSSEPELRLQTLSKDSDNEDLAAPEENCYGDVAAEAKEIIRIRFQIEAKAGKLRQQFKPKSENKYRSYIRSSAKTTNPSDWSTNTKWSYAAPQRHEKKEPRICTKTNNQQTEMKSTKLLQRKTNVPDTSILNKTRRSYVLPPQQLPMEHRQQVLQQACESRKITVTEEKALLPDKAARTDNNREVIQEQRRIGNKIERLNLENQQAAVLEERLQYRIARLQSLVMVFDIWHQYVDYRRAEEVRVVEEFNWRVMNFIMTSWKRRTHRQLSARAADQARLVLVRDRHLNEQAKQFHRLKCLPSWFYRWTMFVTQQNELHAASEATARRREQTERLMERLQRQKAHDHDNQVQPERSFDCREKELAHEVTIECAPRLHHHSTISNTKASARTQHRRTQEYRANVSDNSSQAASTDSPGQVSPRPQSTGANSTRALKRIDKVYRNMEQRTIERKQRREVLKRRYEQLEQKRKDEQEERRAAREDLFLQQRAEEKARIRERKLAEAIAQKEKQNRRDHIIAQFYEAKKHNRRRLLFYYALLPWRKHHALSERIARNATRWHEIRTLYLHWERWQEFLQGCRRIRRRRERAQLEEAVNHYARSLQRRALLAFVQYHQATETRVLAVHRQNKWNSLHRSWMQWRKSLANKYAYQRKILFQVVSKMQQAKLRRICVQWREVTNESKLRKELEREKQQLWRKVRIWLDEDE